MRNRFALLLMTGTIGALVAFTSSKAQAQRVVTYYAPSVATPVTTYAPVVQRPVTTYYAPPVATPVTTYYAPAVTAVPVATPVVAARPVVVRTKVYIPGQPVRNILRAITP